MSLGQFIADVESDARTLRVCNYDGPERRVEAIAEYLRTHDVSVVRDATESGRPGGVLLLESDGEFLAADPVERVAEYVSHAGLVQAFSGSARPVYPDVLARLDDNLFHSYDKRQMVLASRTVEERAWSAGEGWLSAGFQELSRVETQLDVYRKLGASGAEIHVYGLPDGDVSADGVAVHGVADEEVADHWWVVYDGAGDDGQKATLVAVEREPDSYTGFWTFRPDLVDDIAAHLRSTLPS